MSNGNGNGNLDPGGVPDAAEFGLLNAFLATQGYTPTQRKAAVGDNVDGRSRSEISDQLKGWIKEL